jgi:hypothetical protein
MISIELVLKRTRIAMLFNYTFLLICTFRNDPTLEKQFCPPLLHKCGKGKVGNVWEAENESRK